MKKSIKRTTFLAVISLFTLNFLTLQLFAMEQEASQPEIRQPLSLTQLAADAYIKDMQKKSKNSKESALAIKDDLETKCPLITQEIEQIINQRLSKNNVFIEQELSGKILAVLPESNQIVTKGNLGDDNNSVSFWKLYSPANNNSNGLLSGVAASMPGATQALTAQSIIKDGKWVRNYDLELPDNFEVVFVNENIIICAVKTALDNDDQPFEQKKVAVFIKSKNAFKLKKIIEMKHSIIDCIFSSQDNSLAFALDNNTVVFWRYNEQTKTWQEGETIINAAPLQHGIENIAFLNQSYEENPLLFIHYAPFDDINDENENSKPSIVTLWHVKDKKWHLFKEIVKANYIAMYKPIDSKSVTLHATHYNAKKQEKTIFLKEDSQSRSYTSKELTDHRKFSPDGTLSIHREENSNITLLKIVDVTTDDTLKTIEKSWFNNPVFINNNTIAIQWGNCTKILSLARSTNFALCSQVLREAKNQHTINLDDFMQSSLVTQLQPDEKKSIIEKAQQLKSKRSLTGKINNFRSNCRLWSYAYQDAYHMMMIGTCFGVCMTAVYIHSKIDPNFSCFAGIIKNPVKRGVYFGAMHVISAIALTRKISKFFFGS